MIASAAVQSLTCSNCGGDTTATLAAAIASIFVALATFGVVIATFRAATAGRAEAEAAVRAAEATEGLLAAQLRPRLIDLQPLGTPLSDPERVIFAEPGCPTDATIGQVIVGMASDPPVGLCSVPVRNVGPGLARILGVELEVMHVGTTEPVWAASKRFVPSGETSRISVTLLYQHPALDRFAELIRRRESVLVRVRYSGAERKRELYTSLVISYEDDRWRVVDLEFREDADDE